MAGTAAATEQQQQQQQQHPEQAQQQQGASMPEAAAANQQVQQRPAKRHKSSGAEQRQQQQLPAVDLTVFRGKDVLGLTVQLGQEDSLGTDRLVHWCGAQLQATHRAVRELGFQPEGAGVFISRWHHGSPAHRYGLFALHWILEVNGQATPDLDSFLQVVDPLRDGDFARLKVCHLETTQTKVCSVSVCSRLLHAACESCNVVLVSGPDGKWPGCDCHTTSVQCLHDFAIWKIFCRFIGHAACTCGTL
eukprot:GHUV01025015.1.p1 GENE.GHUV01025015.1~~GHUV01025015.1.p1  ORF type:complete len:255 (+),score=89.18 GHUV01025015.1:24-767(+)